MNVQHEKEILHHWGNINQCQHKIEDLRMQIGRLKDTILMEEQEIIKLQRNEKVNSAH